MLCPYCKEPNTQVIDSRTCEEGSAIRRRRKCPTCGARFTTYEKAALQMPLIIKKNGSVRKPTTAINCAARADWHWRKPAGESQQSSTPADIPH